MFASYTPTRMKGTGVVQGLKSLAAKIHPQLPLNTKESNRLLTALTSSFRKHLDEAHPTAARPSPEHEKDTTSKHGGVTKPQSYGIHSSAAYADRHLASVLTNPLLAKGGQRFDYASAQRELTENPANDPIQVLEEYHEKNAATVRIAELCLDSFMKDLTNMNAEIRKEYIRKSEPGRRVFLWLLQQKVYDAAAYFDNLRFQDLLVYFLIQEDRENNIWDWVQIDMTIADGQKEQLHRNPRKQALHSYRWRGRLLRSLMDVKLGIFDRPQEAVSDDRLHEALDAYFKACEMKEAGQRRQDHLAWIPLGGAAVILHRQFFQPPIFEPRTRMDTQRFESFYKKVPLYLDGASKFYFESEYASLDLAHPRNASADRALQFWKNVIAGGNPHAEAFLSRLRNGKGSAETQSRFEMLARTIFLLQEDGRDREVSWLLDNAVPLFPRQSPYLEERFERYRVRSRGGDDQATTIQHGGENSLRVPYPTFA